MSRSFTYTRSHRVAALLLLVCFAAQLFPPQGWETLVGVRRAEAAPVAQAVATQPTPHGGDSSDLLGTRGLEADTLSDAMAALTQVGALGPDGEPTGMLMDLGVPESEFQSEPASLAAPLSISRVQSAYRPADAISGTLAITFTLTNNQPPTLAIPQLPPTATLTDTMEAVTGVDFSQDPHTLHNVLMTDELMGVAGFVAASQPADRQGERYTWNLGDIAPLSSVTLTLEVTVPGTVADFTALDAGAEAWATLQGRMVTAQARPAMLTPDMVGGEPMGEWLKWTVDADLHDAYMLEAAAGVGQDPVRLFEFVRGLGYESYRGSLRGTRGTLWSEAGNALDQASLLIAMLRASGVPARYRHGALDPTQAQTLILSMFPTPTQVIGHIPVGAEVSDPANDATLLAETMDHWWVEAYLPGLGWRDLDPSFANATVGQSFVASVATDGTDRIAEVPDSERHKVTLRVKVELYQPVASLNGNLSSTYPLEVTFNAVELVGNPVTLGHLVNSYRSTDLTDFQVGLFRWFQHTYTPYFSVGDDRLLGSSFQELKSNFPFGTSLVTGEWIEVEVHHPSGGTKSYSRVVKDIVGYEVRLAGGQLPLTVTPELVPIPFITVFDAFAVLFTPGQTPLRSVHAETLALHQQLELVNPQVLASVLVPSIELSAAVQANQAHLSLLGTLYRSLSDLSAPLYTEGMLTHAYRAEPAIVIASSHLNLNPTTPVSNTIALALDLLKNDRQVVALPGQAASAALYANSLMGLSDTMLEGITLDRVGQTPTLSVKNILERALALDIDMCPLSALDRDHLATLPLSREAKARISAALEQGRMVLTPCEMVPLHGQESVAWLEFDSLTGEAIGVQENGLHSAWLERRILSHSLNGGYEIAAGMMGFITPFLMVAHGTFAAGLIATTLCTVITVACPVMLVKATVLAILVDLVRGPWLAGVLSHLIGAERLLWLTSNRVSSLRESFIFGLTLGIGTILFQMFNNDPPLPPFLLAPEIGFADELSQAQRGVPYAATQSGTTLSAHLRTGGAMMNGSQTHRWGTGGSASLSITSLTNENALFYRPSGEFLGSGAVHIADPARTHLPAAVSLAVTGQGNLSAYAPALPGIAAAGEWITYTAELSASTPYTLTLEEAVVTINGSSSYTGSFTLVTSDTTYLTGSGHTAMPTFAAGATMAAQDARITLGPATGSALVAGIPMDASNGLALAGYSGPLTITEASPTTDLVELVGESDFFTLDTLPRATITDPSTPVTFWAGVEANFDDTYTVTVEAPVGWAVEIGATGQVTATPPLGVQPDTYTLLVTARSGAYPDLFVSATHTVTTVAHQGVELSAGPDPLITVPWGPADPTMLPGDTNNGQAQLPGAAYTVSLTNTSTTAHTFDISVTGLPAGWLVVSGATGQSATTVTLPPGGVGQVGLYISPTVSILPPPGTEYPFTVAVTASGNPALTASADLIFTVPAVAFSRVTASPPLIYSAPGLSATVEVGLTNVGNSAGTFDLLLTLPLPSWGANLTAPLALEAGAGFTQSLTLTTPDGEIGHDYLMSVAAPSQVSAQGIYTQTAAILVKLVSPEALCVYRAGEQAGVAGDTPLAAALSQLGLTISELQERPTHVVRRAQVVAALRTVAEQLSAYPSLTAATDLRARAQRWTSASADAILADLPSLCGALSEVETTLAILARHRAQVRLTPGSAVLLVNQPFTATLEVTNGGTEATAYNVTLDAPHMTPVAPFSITLAPAETYTRTMVLTPPAPGFSLLRAGVTVVGLPGLRENATTSVRAVDAFVGVTGVQAEPPFLETGLYSTTLVAEIANIANLPIAATARVAVVGPTGSTVWTDSQPISIPVGNPRLYALGVVDTSGWASGLYTITVALEDTGGLPMPDGTGVGTLGVGQAVQPSLGVRPSVVAPGTITVTTEITTHIQPDPSLPFSLFPPPADRPKAEPVARVVVPALPPQEATLWQEKAALGLTATAPVTPTGTVAGVSPSAFLGPGIIRYEETHPALLYSGSWIQGDYSWSSGSGGKYSRTANDTVSFTFTGSWLHLGVVASNDTGRAEVLIDGVSRGVIDTYHHSLYHTRSYVFDGLGAGSHTLVVRVLGTQNPHASNAWVSLDYVDVWDGTAMADGTFEELDSRVARSSNWINTGTSLYRGSNVWFGFTGESVTYQTVVGSYLGKVELLVDGASQGIFTLNAAADAPHRISLDGLGAGPHVLQVRAYRGDALVDAFVTPGQPPFHVPPTRSGIIRYEEDDPSLRYNGHALPDTSPSWQIAPTLLASQGYRIASHQAGDAMTLNFTGDWVGLGLIGGSDTGQAEVFIDGVSRGVIDSYRRSPQSFSRYYEGLGAGSHTLEVRVLGSRHPRASHTWIVLDFVDVWDGTEVGGSTEAEAPRLARSADWTTQPSVLASGGSYVRHGTSVWYPFTGDSVSLRTIIFHQEGEVRLFLDGTYLGDLDLFAPDDAAHTFSFEGLGAGPHVLHLQAHRGAARVDAFSAPGLPPFTPLVPSGVRRYEEDAPTLRYNGEPEWQMAPSWAYYTLPWASSGYGAASRTANDVASLTFEGSWLALGFVTRPFYGQAEILIDGVSQGVVDTYSAQDDVKTLVYEGVGAGSHELVIRVLGTRNPLSSDSWVALDYVDVWDGSLLAESTYEELDPQVYRSRDWSFVAHADASGGRYMQTGQNVWFPFTGDAVTFLAWSHPGVAQAEIEIDGVSQGVFDLRYEFSPRSLAFRFDGLGAGAHLLRVRGMTGSTVDAFALSSAPLPSAPRVEWHDSAPTGGDGIVATMAAGDLDGNGTVEIATTSATGELYLYRGDGADTGSGSPLLWQRSIGAAPSEPAIAELDGEPGAEIVVGSASALHAFHADGSLYWTTPEVQAYWWAGGPAIANLDSDAAPEIVISGEDCLCILNHDGSVARRYPFADEPMVPTLADLTGDGRLDILTAHGATLYLLDYAHHTTVWTYSLPGPSGIWQAAAVADVDGRQPGGDPGPEIALATAGVVLLLDADGRLLWSFPTGGSQPGPTAIADMDGDGEVEIAASVRVANPLPATDGRIFVLNADGSLLWQALAEDNTSGTGSSVHDLDGDGLWEVLWNGFNQGFTIYRGTDGAVLFNEPLINSRSIRDYPIVADVDGDGYAEAVMGDQDGIYVVGNDGVWGPARPLWNQYSYHITNIADDLSVPPQEPASWLAHNTYRTQTPNLRIAPAYHVVVTHTLPLTGAEVLTGTFSAPPDGAWPRYEWRYAQYWYSAEHPTRFDVRLPDMQPGEVRRISEGTEVSYTLPSGTNHLTLPPLSVTAAHIVALAPALRVTSPGQEASYGVALSNPAALSDTYTLSVEGVPAGWVTLPTTVTLAAGESRLVPLTLRPTPDAALVEHTFAVVARTSQGGQDVTQGTLRLVAGVATSLDPMLRIVDHGEVVSYTLTVENQEAVVRTYTLDLTGLNEALISLPATLSVAAQSVATTTLTVSATTARGFYPFAVTASYAVPGGVVAAAAEAVLGVRGSPQLEIGLAPTDAVGGPAVPVLYRLTLTNTGSLSDTYDLTATVPDGWDYRLEVNDVAVTALPLTPYLFNAAELWLIVTPPAGTPPGSYPLTVTATSQRDGAVQATVPATLTVVEGGVTVELQPGSTLISPTDEAGWDVQVTNTGSVADTYLLSAGGLLSATVEFETRTLALAPGESQTITMTASHMDFALQQSYPIAVTAQSQSEAAIRNHDTATLTFSGYRGGLVGVLPPTQTLTNTLETSYLVVLTNTANLDTDYTLAVSATPVGLDLALEVEALYVPVHMTAGILLRVRGSEAGTYQIQVTATARDGSVTTVGNGTLIILPSAVPPPLGVQLDSFEATPTDSQIRLTWETLAEINNLGFHLYRSTDPAGPGERLNESLLPSQSPGSNQGHAYEWLDPSVEQGVLYYYWLEDVDTSGRVTRHGPVSARVGAATAVTVGGVGATTPLPLAEWLSALLAVGVLAGLAVRRRRQRCP